MPPISAPSRELLLKQDNAGVTSMASVAGDSCQTSTYRGDLSRECLFIHVPWRRRRGDRHRGGDMGGMTDGGRTLLLKKQ